jgi:UDP-N-acetylglucosamine 2-epimerase (non-hydrolysing)
VADALAGQGVPISLVFTGQHPALYPADFGFDPYRCARLACAGLEDPNAHVGLVSRTLVALFADERPILVVVQGDTSSALGGALAANMADVPVAHVEAGLRSHDRRNPWPEEEFRVAIDRQAKLLFAPTELSAANLRRERVQGRIHVTGNSGIDAALSAARRVRRRPRNRKHLRLLVTCHRRENWIDGVNNLATALAAIASDPGVRTEIILHPNPALARRIRELLGGHAGIAFRPPCSHDSMLGLMLDSDLVLSDSGGMQEEAAALGIPLLVLRQKTERPEAIACGNVELVGTDPKRIASAVRRGLNSDGNVPRPSLSLGDGLASQRIAAIIEEWLAFNSEAERIG